VETGYCIQGRIREFWQQQGGLSVFGYPITEQYTDSIEGRSLQVQWFERFRLELHPQHEPPYDVLMGRLGAEVMHQQSPSRQIFALQQAPEEECYFFAETGYQVCGDILHAWRAEGLEFDGQPGKSFAESLALYGFPVSAARRETLSDGKQYTVQWFERVRFEVHPENTQPYHVLAGLLGNETLSAADMDSIIEDKATSTPTYTPTFTSTPSSTLSTGIRPTPTQRYQRPRDNSQEPTQRNSFRPTEGKKPRNPDPIVWPDTPTPTATATLTPSPTLTPSIKPTDTVPPIITFAVPPANTSTMVVQTAEIVPVDVFVPIITTTPSPDASVTASVAATPSLPPVVSPVPATISATTTANPSSSATTTATRAATKTTPSSSSATPTRTQTPGTTPIPEATLTIISNVPARPTSVAPWASQPPATTTPSPLPSTPTAGR
jgi:hypothetical protein